MEKEVSLKLYILQHNHVHMIIIILQHSVTAGHHSTINVVVFKFPRITIVICGMLMQEIEKQHWFGARNKQIRLSCSS